MISAGIECGAKNTKAVIARDGCGDYVPACPYQVSAMLDGDPNDPMRDEPMAIVSDDKKRN